MLFLPSYFRKHRKVYYDRLHNYHEGDMVGWLDFFLDGLIETANASIDVSKKITTLREEDMTKIRVLAKRESESGLLNYISSVRLFDY